MYEQDYKTFRIGPYKTSEIEIQDLFKAWVAISVAFAIVMSNGMTLQTLMSIQFFYDFLR